MTKSFRSALLYHLDRTGLSIAEIARRSGVSKDQLTKVRQRENATTNVDAAAKVAAAFDLTLDEFLSGEGTSRQFEIVSLYNQLSEREQEMLIAAAKGLASRTDQNNSESDEEPK